MPSSCKNDEYKMLFIYIYILLPVLVISQCFDTKYLKTKYTALSRPDYEILDVPREELCKTHCSGNSSCAAFYYNTETSTCVLSGEPDVILNDYKTEVAKRVVVKKKWYPELLVNDEGAECDDAMQFLNAHHYWNGPTDDDRDSGTVWSVTYKKTRDDTGIRIIQHHTLRAHSYAAGCSRWYITFNGAECNSPGSIEQLDYNDVAGNDLRASDVDGTCWTLPSGDVTIETVVGSCEGYILSNSYTGWNAGRTTLIMEVVPRELVKLDAARKCPPAIAFNYQYYAWTDEVDVTFDASSGTEVVKSVMYTKTSNETSLRVKYNALLSVKHVDIAVYCGRWFIAINGTECDPIADIVIHAQYANIYFWANHRRVRTLEGICGNLPAGVYSLEIGVGGCPGSFHQPTNFISGGYNTASRLHIQEIRTEKSMEAKYRFHTNIYANIEYEYYSNLNLDIDVGTLLSIQYDKEFPDTVLRLTATGDHRARGISWTSHCGRWYFTIDGVECSSPGPIEAVSFFGSEHNYHNPMQTSGLCHGVAQGPRTIVYAVGRCNPPLVLLLRNSE